MNQSLLSLYERGRITLQDARERSPNLEEFRQMLSARASRGEKGRKVRRARYA